MPRPRTKAEDLASTRDLDDTTVTALQSLLLDWFAANGRDLPWRRTRDPYRVLVSEVMLQQIQVVRAIPFYEAFVEQFSTVSALANAPLAEAIRAWGDLGRYCRVVYLHQAAQIVVEHHGGTIPRDVPTLRTLPGVGPYTAGAVACFAYEADAAFIDTNMKRVLHRVLVGPEQPEQPVKESVLLGLAARLLPSGRAWAWNSALMDLGAAVCASRKPRCSACPLRERCRSVDDFTSGRVSPTAFRRTPPYRFEESNRFYRGRVLAQLRRLPEGDTDEASIDLAELGRSIRDDFNDEHLDWLGGVVRSLTKDGLAVIAEERPSYDDEPVVRVRLP
ncbi:MAG: A/G-specific adenine glycosylase [Thermomicrobiales bacterium]|nr:A/G-specific adenine glycosylase [Thermomicrobiales bacterium]